MDKLVECNILVSFMTRNRDASAHIEGVTSWKGKQGDQGSDNRMDTFGRGSRGVTTKRGDIGTRSSEVALSQLDLFKYMR